MNAQLNAHLENTLHGILMCQCKGNCILKSLYVDEVKSRTAYITVEPYDDAFNQNQIDETLQKIKRVLLKRRENIWAMLDVDYASVTVYDEWTMKDAFVVDFQSHKITSSVN